MSDLNELFAELKAEIPGATLVGFGPYMEALNSLYRLDDLINNGEFARAEQDAYIG